MTITLTSIYIIKMWHQLIADLNIDNRPCHISRCNFIIRKKNKDSLIYTFNPTSCVLKFHFPTRVPFVPSLSPLLLRHSRQNTLSTRKTYPLFSFMKYKFLSPYSSCALHLNCTILFHIISPNHTLKICITYQFSFVYYLNL